MSRVLVVHPLPRVVFRLTGSTPLAYLHDVLAQDVADLGSGRGALAVALSPKGRVSAELRVLPLDDGVLLDAEPEARAGIEERIGRHAALAGSELVDETDRMVVAAVRGPGADQALAEAGLPKPPAEDAAFVDGDGLWVVRVAWGLAGVDLIGGAEDVAKAVRALGVPASTVDDLEAARIEAGRPRFGPDVNEDVLVNETPLLTHALALDKGCYPGQESVARVHNLGAVRRTLRGLHAKDGEIEPGADVRLDGTSIGRVTSAAGHHAIALLRSDVEPGTELEAGTTRVTLEALT